MKVAALIPARKGSKGIPNKNFKVFCGKPLWQWSEDVAIESKVFDTIFISSDEDRPDELCTDTASLDDVLIYYSKQYPEIDVWCLLQPTSPLRMAQDIKDAFAMLNETVKNGENKYDSIVSVYNHPIIGWVANSAYYKGRKYHTALYHTEKRPNRQDRQDWYLENGAIYFSRIRAIQERCSRVGLTPGLYVMPMERSFEIDNQIDWDICEMLMNRRPEEMRIAI
jgi:CMP-N,N'-diacetyllegionaminic acid synthase